MEEVEKSTADVIAALLAENDALRAALAEQGYEELSKTKADGLVLAAIQPAQPVAVKPLEWGPYPNPVFAGPDISVANVSGAVISYYYQAGRDPDAPGYYVFAAPTHGTLQWRSAGYASIEAAKAAAQADYEASIMAALEVQPLTVQDAALRILSDDIAISHMAQALHDGPLGADYYWFSAARPQGAWCVDAVRVVLLAIAEGRA